MTASGVLWLLLLACGANLASAQGYRWPRIPQSGAFGPRPASTLKTSPQRTWRQPRVTFGPVSTTPRHGLQGWGNPVPTTPRHGVQWGNRIWDRLLSTWTPPSSPLRPRARPMTSRPPPAPPSRELPPPTPGLLSVISVDDSSSSSLDDDVAFGSSSVSDAGSIASKDKELVSPPAGAVKNYNDAINFCSSKGGSLALLEDYCDGLGLTQAAVAGDQWAPYTGDGLNAWVQVGDDSVWPACSVHHEISGGIHGRPDWGADSSQAAWEGNAIMCRIKSAPQEPGTHPQEPGGLGDEKIALGGACPSTSDEDCAGTGICAKNNEDDEMYICCASSHLPFIWSTKVCD